MSMPAGAAGSGITDTQAAAGPPFGGELTAAAPAGAPACGSEHCITCGDDGVPMRVRRVDDASGLALCVDEQGARTTVDVTLVEPVAPGVELLVHAGVAIASLEAA